MVREGLREKVTSELRPEGGEGGKSIAGTGNSKCKGPKVEACLAHLEESKEASVAE